MFPAFPVFLSWPFFESQPVSVIPNLHLCRFLEDSTVSCLMLLVAEQASFPRILLSKPTRWVSADSGMSHERKAFGAALFLRDTYSTFFLSYLSFPSWYVVPGLVF